MPRQKRFASYWKKATNLVSPATVSPNVADTSVSQNSQFKEQFGNQNLSDIPDEILPQLKLKNMNRLIGHLSINSLRNNIDTLKLLFKTSFGGIYDV